MVVRAVRSVLAAISPGDEVIVVDDGSTDDTENALAPFADRIRYVKTANGGAGRARNRGVREARFPLVAFLDSDDEWSPDRLLLGRSVLAARPDVLFCFSDFGLRCEGQPDQLGGLAGWHKDRRTWDEILGPSAWYSAIAELPQGRPDFRVHFGSLYAPLLDALYVPVQTLLVRREVAGSALWFAEDLPTYEDWECTARLAAAGKAAYLATEAAWQWGHGSPRLTDASTFERAAARIAIVERLWASDQDFLQRNSTRISNVLREQRLLMAKWLLIRGRGREARAVVRRVPAAPPVYGLLATMPDIVLRSLFAARSIVRRLAQGTSS
jgi:glycosyltransferase involved in cell wall biosynthesis